MHFRHPSNPPTSQSRVLIAVSPAVDGPLNESPFLSEVGVELSESPAHGVAFTFVMQAIALVLIPPDTRSGIHTVGRFKFWAELLYIDGFDIAADLILHLYTISRILKGDPLHAIVVLANNERGGGRYWTRCRIRVGAICGVRHSWDSWTLWCLRGSGRAKS